MKKIILVTVALAMVACSQNPSKSVAGVGAVASAAGIPGVPALNGAQTVNAGPIIKKLNASLFNISTAQQYTYEAFGLKRKAEEAASRAKVFETGNALDADAVNKSGAATTEIDGYVSSNKKLSSEGKKILSKALPYYSRSLLESAGLGLQMSQAVATISTNPLALASGPYKASDLITVFTSSPKLLTQLATTTGHLSTYASSKGIDTKEVNSSLKDLK